MKIEYTNKRFNAASLRVIEQANEIIDTYLAQGYKLTLRQLYYQFVSRDLIANTVQEYKRLGGLVSDGRLAGLIDWEAIEDRTRNLEESPHWSSPADILNSCAHHFALDRWADQPYRVEVWIEKKALAGVFERVCKEWDVPYLCCLGYTSQSEMWSASNRLIEHANGGQKIIILHFGDHDPSGIDMSRDIQERLAIFNCHMLRFDRLALNMDQVEQYNPPPNPAKQTDSRYAGYIQEFGGESWELDALEPQILAGLVRDRILQLLDSEAWNRTVAAERKHREQLDLACRRWPDVAEFLEGE